MKCQDELKTKIVLVVYNSLHAALKVRQKLEQLPGASNHKTAQIDIIKINLPNGNGTILKITRVC